MSVPPHITLPTLSGRYITNPTLSTPLNNLLSLQGISWFLRKAICALPVTLTISCYTLPAPSSSSSSSSSPPSSEAATKPKQESGGEGGGAAGGEEKNVGKEGAKEDPSILHIDIIQTVAGGIPGTTEKRRLDWEWTPHSDHIFGEVRGRSRWVKVPDQLAPMSSDETDEDIAFLADKLLPPPSPPTSSAAASPAQQQESKPPSKHVDKVNPQAIAAAKDMMFESQVESPKGGWTAHQIWGFEDVGGGRRYVRHVVVRKGNKVERARLVYDYLGEG